MADLPAYNEACQRWFPDWPPAVSYVPFATPGLGIEDARVEINAIALAGDARARLRAIDAGFHTGIDGQPAAVLAGDLLLCSALIAADADGPLPGCAPDPRQPWFGSCAQAQVDHLVARARALCTSTPIGVSGREVVGGGNLFLDHIRIKARATAPRCVLRLLPI